jgi:hypothetical protein
MLHLVTVGQDAPDPIVQRRVSVGEVEGAIRTWSQQPRYFNWLFEDPLGSMTSRARLHKQRSTRHQVGLSKPAEMLDTAHLPDAFRGRIARAFSPARPW